MKKKVFSVKSGRKLLTRTAVAGASLLLATALLQVPQFVTGGGTGFSLIQTAEADTLSQTSGKCGDNATFIFNMATGTVTINGTGDMYDYGSGSYKDGPFQSKDNIKKVVISSGITSVGVGSFYNCKNLKTVEVASSVTRIGSGAFQNCKNLSSVQLESGLITIGNASFRFCGSLSSITIPKTVTTIGFDAFLETSLEEIIIPPSVKEIGQSAFAVNRNLVSVTLNDGLEKIGGYAFGETGVKKLYIPETVSDIENGTALDNDLMEEVWIDIASPYFESVGGGVISLKDRYCLVYVPRAMSGTFTVPSCVTHLGRSAFCGNKKITEIKFAGNEVTSFGGTYTFQNCKSLKKITIPKEVTSLGAEEWSFDGDTTYYNTFIGCESLQEINVEKGNPYYTSIDGVLYNKDKTVLLSYPIGKTSATFRVPDSVKAIAYKAFYKGKNLTHIIMGENVKTIGGSAFEKCTKMSSIVIPASVTSLEDDQFFDCSALKHLVLLNPKDTKMELGENWSEEQYPSDFTIYTYAGATINGMKPSKYVSSFKKAPNYALTLVKGKTEFVPPGSTAKLVPPTGATEETWKNLSFYIYDPAVLKISSEGVITPSKEGKVTEVYAFAKGGACHYYVSTGFSDVKSGDYFHDSVYWAAENGITGGIKDSNGVVTTFNPQGVCTRAHMISFLWRMAGCPEPKSKTSVFTDLDPKAYYYKAVLWGTEQKIVGGYSDNTFRPQGTCSRSQAVTFLWRYYGSPEPKATKSSFSDVTNKNAYYYKAVLWASENGITGGYPDGTFRLSGDCTRAQMVTFLYRYANKKK